SAGLVCYDFKGEELWRREFGKCEQIWGNAASPVIWKDFVILNFGPGETTFLAALNKKTGKGVWKVDEAGLYGKDQSEWMGSWSTPVIARIGNRDEVIMRWADAV